MQKVETTLVDDLAGNDTPAERTVPFGLDGKRYEIDLSSANIDRLTGALAEFIAAARPAGKAKRAAGKASAPGVQADRQLRRAEAKAIREWARGAGHELADRGRIPSDVLDAYREAHAA
jgi:hypothetical protein